jgi:hypothetical protein
LTQLGAIASSDAISMIADIRRRRKWSPQFQMRRDQDKMKADGGNQRRVTGMAPDRRREMRNAADDD